MRVITAFVVRDLRIAWSYRFSFIVQYATLIFSLLSLKYVSRLFGPGSSTALRPYGGDYFSFVLLGVALSVISYPAVRAFSEAVRSAQTTGMLEAMFATRSGPLLIVAASGIYALTMAAVQLLVLVAVGIVLFGAHMHPGNLGLVLLVLLLTFASLAGIGFASAAFVMAFRQTEPFTGAVLLGSTVLSGVLYPTAVLPGWLRLLAPLLPMTHSIALARGLLLERAGLTAVLPHLGALAAFSLLLPAGAVLLGFSVRWAKQTGSLSHY